MALSPDHHNLIDLLARMAVQELADEQNPGLTCDNSADNNQSPHDHHSQLQPIQQRRATR